MGLQSLLPHSAQIQVWLPRGRYDNKGEACTMLWAEELDPVGICTGILFGYC